jgi:myo-inositol 2-dehydrogenase/D-chiro-inositol 1-dehydrogenase
MSAPMFAPLKIGVIGLGRMGQLYAHTLMTQVAGVQLYAVAETAEQLRTSTAREFNMPHATASAHELLSLPELQAVVIATPTQTHAELVIAAARAGKAIFCEKPLALTLDATQRMLDVVAETQIPLQVGFMRRFDGAS